jgi:two-component system nitrogen regulation sensor histidine kinase GlnL
MPVNIHVVLDHVKRVAERALRAASPSSKSTTRPAGVHANRDQLVQVFLNLVKNAAEAIGDRRRATAKSR